MRTFRLPIISFRKAAIFTTLFAALYFLMLVFVHDENARILIADIYFPFQKLLVVAALFYAYYFTAIQQPKHAKPWRLWLIGLVCYGIGDVIWGVLEAGLHQEPFPSFADFFYLMFYVFIWLGFRAYPSDDAVGNEKRFVQLDNLIVVIGSGLSMWTLLIAPSVQSEEPNVLSYSLGILYPALGMVLLWGLLMFFRSHITQSIQIPMLLFGLGIVGEITSDTLFALAISENYHTGSWIDLGWVTGTLFIGLAAILHVQRLLKQPEYPFETHITLWLRSSKPWPMYLPYIWAGFAYAILIINLPLDASNRYLVWGVGIIIALVIFRQVLTINENDRLYQKSKDELLERQQAQEALRQMNVELDQRVNERTEDLELTNHKLSVVNLSLESEIRERKGTEELLHQQIKTRELIASISANFINLHFDEINAEIDRTLEKIGEFVGADRSYIFQFVADQTLISNSYEWCRPGIKSYKDTLQTIPTIDVPWFIGQLSRREVINITDVNLINSQYERALQESQSIQSFAIVPLEWNQSLVGCFGFDAVRQRRSWIDEEIAMMKIVGELLVMALQRKVDQEALSQSALRLKTLHEIDQSILSEQPIDEITTHALRRINELIPSYGGAFVALNPIESSANIYLVKDEKRIQSISLNKVGDPVIYEEIVQATEVLSQGEQLQSHQIPSVIASSLFASRTLRSLPGTLIAEPFSLQGRASGFLCLRLPGSLLLSPDQNESIREVVHSLAIALQQTGMRQELRQRLRWMETALQEKEVLLKEIHHRVKNNLQIISSLLNLQTRLVQDPVARNALLDSQMRVHSMALIHEKLYQSVNLSHIRLGSYIKSLSNDLFHSYQKENGNINLIINVNELDTGIDTAVPVGLILNELISNSLKHAFPGNRSGEIGIDLHYETANTVVMQYFDTGIGLPDGFDLKNRKSLGMSLIYSLSKQLNAEIELVSQSGLKFEIRIPLDG